MSDTVQLALDRHPLTLAEFRKLTLSRRSERSPKALRGGGWRSSAIDPYWRGRLQREAER